MIILMTYLTSSFLKDNYYIAHIYIPDLSLEDYYVMITYLLVQVWVIHYDIDYDINDLTLCVILKIRIVAKSKSEKKRL